MGAKKYTVITRSLGGLNNKIFRCGDLVTAANFPAGNLEKLLSIGGFLKEEGENIDDFTVQTLKTKLSEMGVDHSLTKKKELFQLYTDSKVK